MSIFSLSLILLSIWKSLTGEWRLEMVLCYHVWKIYCSAFNLAGEFHQGWEFALLLFALSLLALSLFCYFALLLFCSFALCSSALCSFVLRSFTLKKIVFFTVFSLLFPFLCPRANRSIALLYMSDHERIAISLLRYQKKEWFPRKTKKPIPNPEFPQFVKNANR